ncbi:hypothetical protein ACOMHN_067650 [Nucella lapillus]
MAVGIRPAGEAATAADKPLDPGSHEMGHFSTGFLSEDLQNRVRAELTQIEAQVHGQRGLSLPLLPLQDPHTDDAPGNWGTSAAENDMPCGTGVPGGGIPSQGEMDTGTPGSPRRLQKQQQAGGGALAESQSQGQIGARAPTRAASPQRYQGHTGAAAPSWGNLPSGAYAPGWISLQPGHLGSDAPPRRAAVPQPWTMGAGAPEHAGPQQRMGADAPVVTFPRLEPTDTNEPRVYRDDPSRNRSLQALLQRYELRPGPQRRQAHTDDEVQIPPPQIYTDGQHPRQLDSYEGKIRTPLRRKRSTDKKRSIDIQQRNAGTHAPTVPRQVPMGTRAPGGTGGKPIGAGALEPRSDYPEDGEHTGIEMKHFGNPLGKPGNPSGKPASAHGSLKLASYYNNHMVLQRGPQRAVLWGTADTEGDTVTAKIRTHSAAQATGTGTGVVQQGKWKLLLPAMTDPGPFVIDVTSADGHVTLRDVLFGDVCLCSGQSNMQFTMSKVMNATAEIQKGLNFHTIRFMMPSRAQSATVQETLPVGQAWTQPTAATLPRFSAVCFLFAEYLQPQLNYPIGLVGTYAQTGNHGYSPNPDMPHTFMAVAMDHGAIHPRYKQEVSDRLVRGALHVAYGRQNVQFLGPFPFSFLPNTPAPTLTIQYQPATVTYITIRSIHGFDVVCSNDVTCSPGSLWVEAPITGHSQSHVTVDVSGCKSHGRVVAVRYEWRQTPCPLRQCAVYDAVSELPAPPFLRNLG